MTKAPEKGDNEITEEAKREAEYTGKDLCDILKEMLKKAKAAKATQRGKDDEGDDDGTFHWEGKPAQWVFAGIRKLTECEDPEKRPGDGTEVSYVEMEAESEEALGKLLEGKPVAVPFKDSFAEPQGRDGSVARAQ